MSEELDLLKQRATTLGIRFSNNIGIETLRNKVAEALASGSIGSQNQDEDEEDEAVNQDDDNPLYQGSLDLGDKPVEPVAAKSVNPIVEAARAKRDAAVAAKKETPQQTRERLIREQTKLVRVRITNLNPEKKDIPGEIFTVGNDFIGTVRKYVPYGEVTENGYHLPYIIYQELKNRKFLSIRTRKVKGQIQVEQNWAKEFALEVLDPLTGGELQRLAIAQAAAAGKVENL